MPRQNPEQGLACLREMGFAVRSFYDADAKFQRFAGADAARAASMMQAAQDADTGILLALRGGYGLSRLMPLIDWDAFAAAGKTCVGYSDFTLCHQQLLRRGTGGRTARRDRQRLALGRLQPVGRATGRKAERDQQDERPLQGRTPRAVAMAARTLAGAVPPKLTRLATEASTDSTS